MRTTNIIAGVIGLACLAVATGCAKGSSVKELYGSVTCNGENVPMGQVSFIPIEGESDRIRTAPIIEGQYRIEVDGGLPLGKYRVQVDARRKTGRKVERFNGVERAMVDEEVSIGPKDYGNQRSPLTIDVSSDFPGQYDIVMPQP